MSQAPLAPPSGDTGEVESPATRDAIKPAGSAAPSRWAADPREFVTSAIHGSATRSGTFADVKVYDGRSPVDYILSGRLESSRKWITKAASRLRFRSPRE
jgi:hypothetical protein